MPIHPQIAEMAAYNNFILIKGKIPLCKWQEPTNRVSYDQAKAAQLADPSLGVGYVFTEADPFFCVDVDECYDAQTQQWSGLSQEMMFTRFPGAYLEMGRSGDGVHLIAKSTASIVTRNDKVRKVDTFTDNHYVVLTEDVPPWAGERSASTDCAAAFNTLITDHAFKLRSDAPTLAEAGEAWTSEPVPEYTGPEDDAELIRRMLAVRPNAANVFANTATVADLWHCNVDALGASYPSSDGDQPFDHTKADFALASHLAFWTGRNAERMLSLMSTDNPYADYRNATSWGDSDRRPRLAVSGVLAKPGAVYDKKPAEPGAAAAATVESAKASGALVTLSDYADLFKGCYYLLDTERIFTHRGPVSSKTFNVMFGGRLYYLDALNMKSTRAPFDAFRQAEGIPAPTCDRVCFKPGLPFGEIRQTEGRDPKLEINCYRPDGAVRIPCTAADVAPMLDHIALLIPHAGDREVVLSFLASCVRFPGDKFKWALALQGTTGNGKSIIVQAMRKAIGYGHSYQPNSSNLDVDFNSWRSHKILIAFEDLPRMPSGSKAAQDLLDMITCEIVSINDKGIKIREEESCEKFIFSTNDKGSLPISNIDRRLAMVYTAQQAPADNERDGLTSEYFDALGAWISDNAGKWAYYLEEVHEIKIDPRNGRKPTLTSDADVLTRSLSTAAALIHDKIYEEASGFRGGFVSRCKAREVVRDLCKSPKAADLALEELGYVKHEGVPNGLLRCEKRSTIAYLYVKSDSPFRSLVGVSAVREAYLREQGGTEAEQVFGTVPLTGGAG